MEVECPNCDESVEVGDCWSALQEEFTCPACGCRFEIDGDYLDVATSSWAFWPVETDEWVAEQRAKDEPPLDPGGMLE